MSRALASVLAGLVLASAAPAAEPDPDDPPLCRAAIEARPGMSALEALGREEKRLAAQARSARREARKLMRDTLGAGAGARAVLPAYEAWMARESDARRAGKSICHCRERRNDPLRDDCERLYPVVLP